MSDLWSKIAHTTGASLVSMLGSVASLAITARVLGPSGRGLYAAAIAWVALFAVLGSLSLGQVLIHHVAGRAPEEWLPEVTGAALTVTVGCSVAGWLVLAVLYLASGGQLFGALPAGLLAAAFVALPLLIWNDTGRYVLTALGRVRVSNLAQVAGALVGVAGMAALVMALRLGLVGAVVAYVLTAATAAAISGRQVVRLAGRVRPQLPLVRRLLRGSAQLHLNAVGSYAFTQASVLVLNYYRPASETGHYQLAMQLFGMSLVASGAIATVGYELVAKHGPDGAWPAQRRLLLQSTLVLAAVAALGYVLAPLAIRLVAGAEFLPAVPLFRALLPALVGATFAMVMASQWIGRGLFLQAALLTFASGVVSLACDVILIPRYGARGALVSTLVTYGVAVVGNGAMALWVQARVRHAGAPQPAV